MSAFSYRLHILLHHSDNAIDTLPSLPPVNLTLTLLSTYFDKSKMASLLGLSSLLFPPPPPPPPLPVPPDPPPLPPPFDPPAPPLPLPRPYERI